MSSMPLTARFILLFFISFLFAETCFPQNPSFKRFTVDDGMPSMEIYHIMQDKKGLIWIATNKGVSKFDGKFFENFSIENGLPDNEILKIYEDAKGRIWFLSLTGKISFYDGTIHNSQNTPFLINNVLQKPMRAFAPLSSGEIIFCPQDNPTYILDDTIIKQLTPTRNYSVFEKNDHSALMIDNSTSNIVEWKNKIITTIQKIQFNSDYDLCEYDNLSNKLLIAKINGLYYYNNKEFKRIDKSDFYNDQHIRLLTIDKEGHFWLSANTGCSRFTIDANNQLKNLEVYFKGFVINDVFEDANHNFWIATRGDGLLLVPSLHVKLFDKSSGLADNNITSAAVTEEGILCGTLNGYLHLINKNNEIKETINLNSLRVQKILNDGKNTWIACERKLFRKENSIVNVSPDPLSTYKTIALDKDGNILSGGFSSVYKISKKSMSPILKTNYTIRFYAVCDTGENVLFLGTEKGVYVFKNDSLQPFHHDRKPFTGWIDVICKTKNGKILITTRDSGLAIIDKNSIDFISTSNGLQSNSCGAMFYDTFNDKIYLGTNKGLSIISPLNNNSYSINNYNASNGLQCGSINSIYENAGNILACTDKGLLEIAEKNLSENNEVPKIFLQKIEINNRESKPDSSFLLKYDENNIRITYNGTSFRDPKSLIYRYKLTPSDTSWNLASTNTIIYPDLPPGKYHFAVQVRAGDDHWTNEEAAFDFEIDKPYWQTGWFRIIGLLIFGCTVYIFYRFRLNQSKRKHEIKMELLQTELKALRSQINPHFIFNSLNSIQDFIFNNEKEEANEYLSKFAKLIRLILDNSVKKQVTLSEEINFLNIYLQLESLRFTGKFKYSIKASDNVNSNECLLPPMILQLYIENAIIHGLAKKEGEGLLTINFEMVNNFLECAIEDNGIGRKKSEELNLLRPGHQSIGMNNTNERIEAINKAEVRKIQYRILDLEDSNGNAIGTKIILKFPQVQPR